MFNFYKIFSEGLRIDAQFGNRLEEKNFKYDGHWAGEAGSHELFMSWNSKHLNRRVICVIDDIHQKENIYHSVPLWQ